MEWSKDEPARLDRAQHIAVDRGWHLVQHPDPEAETVSYSLTLPTPVQLDDLSLDDVESILAKTWHEAAR